VGFDVHHIRHDFAILDTLVYKKPLVYLDNAATTQKPKAVIERIENYYRKDNANIHRGVHYLSQKATDAYEQARENIRSHLNAAHAREIIFTKGATEAINLVAQSYAGAFLEEGDEIIVSQMEHHSNLVPWQVICQVRKAKLRVIPFDDSGELDITAYKSMISEKTRFVAVTHVSNVLGTINPVKHITDIAHKQGIPVLVDGAQAIPHFSVDVQDLGCDFYCFSAHKVYGPMGAGVLYGKEGLLDNMPPYQTGGEMVDNVTLEYTTYNELPFKFEAGTPNVAGVLGMDEAIKYINNIELKNIGEHEKAILDYATIELLKINGLQIYGETEQKASVISFNLEGIHPYDAGTIIDKMGVAVRTGHHCTQPIMDRYGVPGMIRASFALYNTPNDVDRLVVAVQQAKKMLG
jgi:cysteine desulfurase/selenocysteine lyase